MTEAFGPLVATDWLARELQAADLRVVDATWYLPTEGKNGRAEYLKAHIPGAVFFDIDAIADRSSGLPHMLPAPEAFAREAGALGISDRDRIVVYDAQGLYSAARVWWSFRAMGHERVWVLDGGLPKWRTEGRALASGEETPHPQVFQSRFRPELLRDRAQVLASLEAGTQIVDARSAGRFAATEPEPRPGVRGGHIPGSRNLPFAGLIDPARGSLRPPEELARAFAAAGVRVGEPATLLCGSGVTACVLALALDRIGRDGWAVYDGSWAEWGSRAELPIER